MIKLITPRVPTSDRRDQMVAATLRLLARTSIEALSTRQLAAELGISQPALFRHFRNREALLLAVVDYARSELERIAVGIVEDSRPAVQQLRALGMALLENAERLPGLPRLLFSSATPTAGKVRDALRHIVSMQAALVAELVRQGQRDGDLDAELDPGVAATMFIGMVQSLVLSWEIRARSEPLADQFGALFELWQRAVKAPTPGTPATRAKDERPPRQEVRIGAPLAAIDVRPIIASGVDPLVKILAALESLPPGGVLIVEAPFRPAPLLALLARRGHHVSAEELGAQHWLVEAVIGGSPQIEDLRDLEPPEPMHRVLDAVSTLPPGSIYLARLPRYPRLLLPELRNRKVPFDILERSDGAALLRVESKP